MMVHRLVVLLATQALGTLIVALQAAGETATRGMGASDLGTALMVLLIGGGGLAAVAKVAV